MLSQEQLTAVLKAFGEAVPAGTKLHSLKVRLPGSPAACGAVSESGPVYCLPAMADPLKVN